MFEKHTTMCNLVSTGLPYEGCGSKAALAVLAPCASGGVSELAAGIASFFVLSVPVKKTPSSLDSLYKVFDVNSYNFP